MSAKGFIRVPKARRLVLLLQLTFICTDSHWLPLLIAND
jgi:hypothetical protein